MIEFPSITALVVTYHTGPRLHECLYALKGDPEVTQIVIADNGNPPGEQAWIDRFVATCAKASLIRKGDNPGFAVAVNRAAEVRRARCCLAAIPTA
ncbi:MAG: glycosyltransferase [Hyphomonas sp.]